MEKCVAYERCGACAMLETPYAEQLARKRDAVARAFRAEGLRVQVQDVCGMEEPFHYRNKVIAAVSMRGPRVVCGLYEAFSHRVVPLSDCLLQDRRLNAVLSTLESLFNSLKIRPFGYGGVLRHVLLRVGVRTGQVMVVLVTSEELMHGRKELVSRLRAAHPSVATVVQNIQPRQTSVVLGPREKVLYGPGFIYDELLGLRYKISARSFYQVNPAQTERLYSLALSLAALRPGDVLLDAYCGIGTIGLSAASGASVAEASATEVQNEADLHSEAGKTGSEVQNGVYLHPGAEKSGSEVQNGAYLHPGAEKTGADVQNGVFLHPGAGKPGSEVQNGVYLHPEAGKSGSEVQNGVYLHPGAGNKGPEVRVIGVEINGDAVRDAVANARANGIRNARFYCDDVSAFMRDFDAPVNVLMLDPPRAGCDEPFLRSVLRLSPERIVYVSCNPETQARDVAFLTRGGRYRIDSDACPVDMFPHTGHIENVLALRRG